MSLVEDSQAGSTQCHTKGGSGHCGDIGKDSPIFEDAVKFLKKVEEQWWKTFRLCGLCENVDVCCNVLFSVSLK